MTEVRQQRRLATILAADVFGYSRLTAENEEDALRTLKAHRVVIDRLIARHDGRSFNIAGDSVLAEFGSAVKAVRCAITIQEELRVRNAQIDENRRMDFRIGINVGDVLVDGDNLYGDGVNIAARLESIAAPGQYLYLRAACVCARRQALLRLRRYRPANDEEHSGAGICLPARSKLDHKASAGCDEVCQRLGLAGCGGRGCWYGRRRIFLLERAGQRAYRSSGRCASRLRLHRPHRVNRRRLQHRQRASLSPLRLPLLLKS